MEETWAVIVGWRWELNRDPATGKFASSKPDQRFPEIKELTLLFVEKHGCDADGNALYHRIGMENEIDESKTSGWTWVERSFTVGGRGRGERMRFDVGENGPQDSTGANGRSELLGASGVTAQ